MTGPPTQYNIPYMTSAALPLPDILTRKLDLGGTPTVAVPLVVEYVRDITPDDLVAQAALPTSEDKSKPLEKIRAAHHNLARLIADGHPYTAISRMTGYSTSRIKILEADPAFQELIMYYQHSKEVIYADTHEQLANITTAILGEVQDRLEENPEQFSVAALREFAQLGLDRTGFGPTKTVKKDVSGTVSLVHQLRKQVEEERQGKVKPRELVAGR